MSFSIQTDEGSQTFGDEDRYEIKDGVVIVHANEGKAKMRIWPLSRVKLIEDCSGMQAVRELTPSAVRNI